MSGPKGGSYVYVPTAEELRRQAVAAARQRVTASLRRFERASAGISREVAGHLDVTDRITLPAVPASEDAAVLDRYCAEVERLTDRLVAAHHAAAERRTEALLAQASLGFEIDRSEEPLSSPERPPTVEEVTVDGAPARDVEGSVARSLAALPASVPASDRAACEELAAATLADGSTSGALELRRRVQVLALAEERRTWQRDAAAAAADRLAPHAGDAEVATLLETLDDVGARGAGWTEELEREVHDVELAARSRAEQAAAATALGETLGELGYDVEEGFTTLVAEAGVAHARMPGADDYAVRWRLSGGRMAFHVIRDAASGLAGEAQRLRDLEVEAAWCREVDGLLERLARRGVQLELDRLTPPGTHPVHVVDQLPGRPAAGRAARSNRPRARALKDDA